MKSKLVDMNQPFGEVHNFNPMGGEPTSKGGRNSIGPTNEVPNHGANLTHSFADQAPGAAAYAARNNSNPFAWTGHPRK